MINSPLVRRLVELALNEDLSSGDVTAELGISAQHRSCAHIIAREHLVVCGVDIVPMVRAIGAWEFSIEYVRSDGDIVKAQEPIVRLQGSTRELLSAERTLLNFLQRLCGVATYTRSFVDACGPGVAVLDTRKTMPGWRVLDKYAVRIGGGRNHRFSLGDMILVKNNHIDAHPGGLRGVLADIVAHKPLYMPCEVEVRNLAELKIALEFHPDIVMLDNFSDANVQEAMQYLSTLPKRPRVEVSGGITRERAHHLGTLGVDAVSVGGLTTRAPNVDISMRIESLTNV